MESDQFYEIIEDILEIFENHVGEEFPEGDSIIFPSVNEILWNETPVEVSFLLAYYQKDADEKLAPLRFWMGGRSYFKSLLAHCDFLSPLPNEYTDGFVLCLRTSKQEHGISPLTQNDCAILLDSLPCALFSDLNARMTESGFDFIA
ncbi:hypothetical protein LEP1GSC105_2174 [Leptospira interrogans str. UI 12758]|uniref:Uncharacterized protein n=1 Tax=Leptospira interrogans str. UI 12758 TaxID=1049938 RepID=A0A0E2DJC4_LEPIR|nr:hypothetical protein LEP1GSC105_2174 [Leptospira interrogans str. UI 12758]